MKAILVFQTDFTYKEGAVGAMYGVVKSVDRSLEIIDASHEIPQYDSWSASYRLHQIMKFWPMGTVFVSVVDPGVGTKRRACVAKSKDGYYIVTPDNGSLTHIKKTVGIEEVREIDESVNRLKGKGTEGVSIFHGRDLFAYCAARLASGIIDFEGVGPSYDVEEIIEHPIYEALVEEGSVKAMFEISDPNFGNMWTNVKLEDFNRAGFSYGEKIASEIYHKGQLKFKGEIFFHSSFGDVEKGQPLIYNNELMKIGLAVNMGSFAKEYGVDFGPDWTILFTKI